MSDAITSIVDALSGPTWTQHARLLTLHTPLGADVLLAETADIEETLGPVGEHAGYRIRLTALGTDNRLALTGLLGQAVRLDLQTAQSRSETRPFHGHVTGATHESADGGFLRYRLVIEPWLAFLGHNQDNYLFQDKSVIDIVDELLADWQGQGRLVPAWRWRLADAGAYPKRGMTVQYQESDLAFLKRLLAEEGLFCWFEHSADDSDTLGRHTLILADHNGAFTDNRQARIRYTQAGATLGEDSLDRWHGQRTLDTGESHSLSWDYRSRASRAQSHPGGIDNGAAPRTVAWHDPGQYAWQDLAQGERMIGNQRQALDARMKQYQGQGTVRTAAPGTCFELAEHFEHDRDPAEQRRFLITRVTHQARNNLGRLIGGGSVLAGGEESAPAIDHYRNRLTAIRAHIPWRPLLAVAAQDPLPEEAARALDAPHGRHLHPRPTARGTLTGIVVGDGGPTHTDRDGRIRVAFPWQRGSRGASRGGHPSGSDNAPGDARLGVWLRVLTPVAGDNWGGHLTPRPGQEVIVAFQNGNIDRPVVIGAAYNGQGNADAPGNRNGGGGLQASANAPAWFAGEQDPEHTHGASLSGLKSQQLSSSRSGQGGHNQLLFDDTPGEGRIELGTSQYQSTLQLGHLKQQTGNARQKNRGHGGELATQASLALRAGSGLLLTADARPGAAGTHLDSREAIARSQAAHELTRSLADLAQKQNAALKNDPAPDKLPACHSLQHAGEVLSATASHGHPAAGDGDIKATQGGGGTVPAWSEPRLQTSAPGGIAQVTPQNHLLVAGTHLALVSEHDSQIISQGRHALAVKDGLALFSHGKSKNAQKPNQESGTHLHAASGKVSVQAQRGRIAAAAEKKVTLASTQANLKASAKKHLLATAQGAHLKLEGGNIELHAPGKVEFKASLKKWTGPAHSNAEGVVLPKAKDLFDEQFVIRDQETQEPIAGAPYRIEDDKGRVLFAGIADANGQTVRLTFAKPQKLKLFWGK